MIKITKIQQAPNADFPTPSWENFKVGVDNAGVSLPIDYTVEGELVHDIEVGDTIKMFRDKRNNVKCTGLFMTSVVTKIEGEGNTLLVHTRNSIYLVEKI